MWLIFNGFTENSYFYQHTYFEQVHFSNSAHFRLLLPEKCPQAGFCQAAYNVPHAIASLVGEGW